MVKEPSQAVKWYIRVNHFKYTQESLDRFIVRSMQSKWPATGGQDAYDFAELAFHGIRKIWSGNDKVLEIGGEKTSISPAPFRRKKSVPSLGLAVRIQLTKSSFLVFGMLSEEVVADADRQ